MKGRNPRQLSRALLWLLELLWEWGCGGNQGRKGKAWAPGLHLPHVLIPSQSELLGTPAFSASLDLESHLFDLIWLESLTAFGVWL